MTMAFYARSGFEEFLCEPHPSGGEVVHMKRSLAPWAHRGLSSDVAQAPARSGKMEGAVSRWSLWVPKG